MASIHKEIAIAAPAAVVWAAIRDVGAVHTQLAQNFVVGTQLDGDSRLVTFANGAVVRERIVDIDDARRRLAYAAVDWKATHHHATFQVFADGDARSRVVWVADLLPHDLAGLVESMMQQGSAAIKETLERTTSRPG
jgi:hypothetical protein